MNKLAYLLFAMCIAISGCSMDEKSATHEESASDTPVEASTDAIITNSETRILNIDKIITKELELNNTGIK